MDNKGQDGWAYQSKPARKYRIIGRILMRLGIW